MSDTGTFKSSQAAAQLRAGAILGAAMAGGIITKTAINRTTLSVVDNIKNLEEQLSACNAEFKQLVADDTDSILKLSEFFTDFDTDISEHMNSKDISGYKLKRVGKE